MNPPPAQIDGATVLQYADLTKATPTGKTRHIVEGETVRSFAALALAGYESESEVYLFYCDHDWNAVTDTQHDSVQDAIRQANFEFGLLRFIDVRTEAGTGDVGVT
jgi:hypothetical protein